MEPNKTEQHFKEQLEQRTIQPSAAAWDRLDAMLSVAEKKEQKKKPNRGWLYIAASFLVFLLLGVLYLNQGKATHPAGTNNNSVVTTEKPAEKQTEAQPVVVENQKEETAVAAVTAPATVKKQKGVNPQPENKKIIAVGSVPVPEQSERVAQVSGETVKQPKIQVDANALLASVDKTSVGEAQIQIKNKKPAIKVDSNSLLSSVEGELNESFRDKAYDGIIRNFNAVKSSVANRNKQ